MFKVYRENGGLFIETKLQMKCPVKINDVVYSKQENITFEELDLVHKLLRKNARVLISVEGNFIKPNLYDFEKMITEKTYNIIDGLPNFTDVDSEKPIEPHAEDKPEFEEPEKTEDEILENTESKKHNLDKNQNNNDKKRNKNRHNIETGRVEEGDK